MADTLVLNPGLVRLATLERNYRQQSTVRLTPSPAVILAMAMGEAPVLWGQPALANSLRYGSRPRMRRLSSAIRSIPIVAPTPEPIVRLTMALELILFGRARLCGNGGT